MMDIYNEREIAETKRSQAEAILLQKKVETEVRKAELYKAKAAFITLGYFVVFMSFLSVLAPLVAITWKWAF